MSEKRTKQKETDMKDDSIPEKLFYSAENPSKKEKLLNYL